MGMLRRIRIPKPYGNLYLFNAMFVVDKDGTLAFIQAKEQK